jgi:hypothetical protein
MRFRFFVVNDFGVLLLLFWLFTVALSSFSYFLSTFMSRAQSATYTGFAVFLVSLAVRYAVVQHTGPVICALQSLRAAHSQPHTQGLQCFW